MSRFFRPPKDPVLSDRAERDIETAQEKADRMERFKRRGDYFTMDLHGVPPCPFCGYDRVFIRMILNLDLGTPRIFKTVRCRWCGSGTHESAAPVRWHVVSWCRRVVP